MHDRSMRGNVELRSDRRCLREPIPEIFEAAQLLRAGVDAHLRRDTTTAADHFAAANLPAVREWTESIWGKHNQEILQIREVRDAPLLLAATERIPVRMPNVAERSELIARDGYQCRFCGVPLVPKSVRQRIVSTYPEVVKWGRSNPTQHAALQALWLQFDHVVPHSSGGTNDLTNLIVTCAPCNYGKMSYTLAELGLVDPRIRQPNVSDWNGLIDFR